jgi:8-oxo-dGTP diphosphatase
MVKQGSAEMFATPRLASGALFADDDKVLLVHKTYGNGWDIPGGYVDRGESPASACERELHEELGLTRTVRRLLVHDWAPSDAEGDKILYIFDCGQLGSDEDRLHLDASEIDKTEWVAIGGVARLVIPRLARRLASAYEAYASGTFLYLEHGEPVVPLDV